MGNRFSVQGNQVLPDDESDDIQPESAHNTLPESTNIEEEIKSPPTSAYCKICTYNIQTVRNNTRLKKLNNFLIDGKIDVLALQETNWAGEKLR